MNHSNFGASYVAANAAVKDGVARFVDWYRGYYKV